MLFFPLIKDTIIYKKVKFNKEENKFEPKPPKVREIKYCSHIDSWIYSYYSSILNEKYDEFTKKNLLDDVSVAYRDNLGKSTIDIAKETFDFIKSCQKCYIIVSDFKSYFDNIDHKNLKMELCQLLGESTLPEDFYAVFKSVTKYSYVEKEKLEKFIEDNNILTGKKCMYCQISELRKRDYKFISHDEKYGIPQGLSISAVLANINLCSKDLELKKYIDTLKGKYVRYSDDTIFIVPFDDSINIDEIFNKIKSIFTSIDHLALSVDKTHILKYDNGIVYKKNDVGYEKSRLDYLGFIFENGNVRLRDKTVYKYNYRLKRKIIGFYNCQDYKLKYDNKKIVDKIGLSTIYSNNVNRKRIKKYRRYKQVYLHGNYFKYLSRCRKKFIDSKSIKKAFFSSTSNINKKMKKYKK